MIFLDADITAGTATHVFGYCEYFEGSLLSTLAFTSFMPSSLAIEARELLTVFALELVTGICFFDFFLALKIRTPNHTLVLVDKSR